MQHAGAARAPERRSLGAGLGVVTATLLGFLSLGAVLPVLPRYVAGPLDGGSVAVGVVVGAFALTAVFSRPLGGGEADRRGRRLVVVSGLVIVGAASALLFVPAGIGWLVFARLAVGVGDGFMYTAAVAWAVDLAPATRRAQVVGLLGLSVWGGVTLGSLAGGLLLDRAGYEAVWAFATVCPLAGAALARALPEPPRPAGLWPGREWLPRPVVLPGLVILLMNVGYVTIAGFSGLLLAERGVGRGATVFTIMAASVVAARLVLGRVADRVGGRPVAVAGTLVFASGLAILAVSHAFWVAAAGAITVGVAFALVFPALALIVMERVEDTRRGVALGAFTGFYDVGVAAGGPLAGAVASVAGYGAAFWTACAVAVCGAGVAWLATRSRAATEASPRR